MAGGRLAPDGTRWIPHTWGDPRLDSNLFPITQGSYVNPDQLASEYSRTGLGGYSEPAMLPGTTGYGEVYGQPQVQTPTTARQIGGIDIPPASMSDPYAYTFSPFYGVRGSGSTGTSGFGSNFAGSLSQYSPSPDYMFGTGSPASQYGTPSYLAAGSQPGGSFTNSLFQYSPSPSYMFGTGSPGSQYSSFSPDPTASIPFYSDASVYSQDPYGLGSYPHYYDAFSGATASGSFGAGIDPFAGATASGNFGTGVDPFAGATASGDFGTGVGPFAGATASGDFGTGVSSVAGSPGSPSDYDPSAGGSTGSNPFEGFYIGGVTQRPASGSGGGAFPSHMPLSSLQARYGAGTPYGGGTIYNLGGGTGYYAGPPLYSSVVGGGLTTVGMNTVPSYGTSGLGGSGGGGVFATPYMHGGVDPSSSSSPGPMDSLVAGHVMPEAQRQPGDIMKHGISTDADIFGAALPQVDWSSVSPYYLALQSAPMGNAGRASPWVTPTSSRRIGSSGGSTARGGT